MKKRMGYNIIELLVVITAISLITAIAYKGVNILFDNIKVEGVKTEISKLKAGLGKSQAVGNIYWGGDLTQATGPISTVMNFLTPLQHPSNVTGGCNFSELYDGAFQKNCSYDNIIAAERELFLQMGQMEFKYVNSDHTFRSSQFPVAKIGFLPNVNGYAGIIITDIPGNIAKKVYQDLNSPKWDPIHDGLTSDRPLLIFPGGLDSINVATLPTLPIMDTTLGANDGTGLSTYMTTSASTGWDVGVANKNKALDYISNIPKVTIIYMYTYRNKTWK